MISINRASHQEHKTDLTNTLHNYSQKTEEQKGVYAKADSLLIEKISSLQQELFQNEEVVENEYKVNEFLGEEEKVVVEQNWEVEDVDSERGEKQAEHHVFDGPFPSLEHSELIRVWQLALHRLQF